MHGVVNKNRYYEMFEVIRNGAEAYFRVTGRNYFSDLLQVHSQLGLTFVHKEAALIIPIVSSNCVFS